MCCGPLLLLLLSFQLLYREWLQLPPSLMTVKEAVLLIQRLAYIQERWVVWGEGGLCGGEGGGAAAMQLGVGEGGRLRCLWVWVCLRAGNPGNALLQR